MLRRPMLQANMPITKMGDDVRFCCRFDGDDDLPLSLPCLNSDNRPFSFSDHNFTTPHLALRLTHSAWQRILQIKLCRTFGTGREERKSGVVETVHGGRIPRGVTTQTSESGLLYVYQRTMRNGSPGTAFSAPVCVAA